jgi:hypothetical protein
MRGLLTRRASGNESLTHFVCGRNSTKLPSDLRKMPTDTGSTIMGPRLSR